MSARDLPFSACQRAILHKVADGDADVLAQLVNYFRDPHDDAGERWQFLRLAETDAWTAVELLLLRNMIERRFSEGIIDAWVHVTPLGEEIRDSLTAFFDSFRAVEFPSEPRSFGAFAFQELCAARLVGQLDADVREAAGSAKIMERLAATLFDRYPQFAQAIEIPGLDIPGMGWGSLDWRIRCSFETLVALPTDRTPPSNHGLEDLVVLLINCPSTIERLICDVYADCEFTRRARVAEIRTGIRDNNHDDLKREATAEVKALLGRAVPIHARTLAEAVAIAERLRADQNILIGINSLWKWYLALPAQDRNAIGEFRNARDLWMKARFRNRLQ